MSDSLHHAQGIRLVCDVDRPGAWATGLFADRVTCEGLRYVRRVCFVPGDFASDFTDAGVEVVFSQRGPDGETTVLGLGAGMLALVRVNLGRATLWVAGNDPRLTAARSFSLLRRWRAPNAGRPNDPVPISVWGWDGGPASSERSIAALPWPSIAQNYAPATRRGLDSLMAARPGGAGGLVIWEGPPGTGKTYATRALAHAWRSWCSTHVITDHEIVLGMTSSFMVETVFGSEEKTAQDPTPARWHLLILEDCGALLGTSAPALAGEALPRLLGLTDGVLGENVPVVILVTNSEPLGALHPAVERPGRCWSHVKFGSLPGPQARSWLAAGNASVHVDGPMTLAELYAAKEGRPLGRRDEFGFARQP